MAFRPPTFNLTASVWFNPGPGTNYAAPSFQVQCCLSMGKRVFFQVAAGAAQVFMGRELLVPKGADIRCAGNTSFYGLGQGDLIEVPAGSKRLYKAHDVDDVGKGYPNEYRIVIMGYQPSGFTFADIGLTPAPLPMP